MPPWLLSFATVAPPARERQHTKSDHSPIGGGKRVMLHGHCNERILQQTEKGRRKGKHTKRATKGLEPARGGAEG